MHQVKISTLLAGAGITAALFFLVQEPTSVGATALVTLTSPTKIEPYEARFGRSRPVVAVLGENSATELTDFAIPYGVLSASGDAEVLTLSTQPGVITMRPALQIQPDATVKDFDAKYPQGADYVIVPAMRKRDDPVVLSWIADQARKGATIVSICDGALVVANTGLMKGRKATAHWATQTLREEKYPDTRWVPNVRYIADGKIVSSAGISAAMPVSIALVEAISGTKKANAIAHRLGVRDWSTRHNSDAFRSPRVRNLLASFEANYANKWVNRQQAIALPLASGIDDISVAFIADAYTRTGRGKVFGVSNSTQPVVGRYGLKFVSENHPGQTKTFDVSVAPSKNVPPGLALDGALAGITKRYGPRTAYAVSMAFEYPR
jgi:putative intracellular protease/amidase